MAGNFAWSTAGRRRQVTGGTCMLFPPISDSLPAKIQSTFGGKSPSISRQIIVRIPTDFHGALPAKSYYVELLDESSIFPPSSIFLSMATMNDAAGGWVAIVRAGLSISLRRTSLSLSLSRSGLGGGRKCWRCWPAAAS